jgi:hypothetical protein
MKNRKCSMNISESELNEIKEKMSNKGIWQANTFGLVFTKTCDCCIGTGQQLDSVKMGEQLRSERVKLKISTERLAEKIGISQQEVCQYELGQRQWKINDIARFHKGLEQARFNK